MKSMSWLLFEKEHGYHRECPACGFATCSPSIYRRHTRHCVVSKPAAHSSEPANGTVLVPDLPDISKQPSADLRNTESSVSSSQSEDLLTINSQPNSDFPSVSCQSGLVFPDISCESVMNDQGVRPSAHLDDGTDKAAMLMEVAETGHCSNASLVNTWSDELLLLTTESTSLVPLEEAPSNSLRMEHGLDTVPVNVESQSPADCVSTLHDMVDSSSSPDKSDGKPTSSHDALNIVANSHVPHSSVELSESDGTEDDEDEVKDGNSPVVSTAINDSSSVSTVTDLPAIDSTSPMDESRVNTSPRLAGKKKQTSSKKSPRNQKSLSLSNQSRCKYCSEVLASRLERRTHMQTKHRDKIPVFHCTNCNYSSVEHKNYERHLLRHLLPGPFRCDTCSFSSTSQSSIKRHVALQHGSPSLVSTHHATSSETLSEASGASKVPPADSSAVTDRKSTCEVVTDPVSDASHENLPLSDSSDEAGSTIHSRGNTAEVDESDTKPSVSSTSSGEAVIPATREDTTQSVVEVEVRIGPSEESGMEETLWTCLACGSRYNERAKVRRHVKCKHRIALTKCCVHDLRGTAPTQNRSSDADSLTVALEQARTSNKSTLSAGVDEPSATDQQNSVGAKAGKSLVSSRMKLPPKSFVKIAPKPIPLDGSCQTAPVTVISSASKTQVLLPKCNWKQMPFSLQSANSTPGPSSSTKDVENSGTCDAGSELKKHLMDNAADENQLNRSADISIMIVRKEPDKDLSTQEVPKKKQRLILRAKTNKLLLEPHSSNGIVCESVGQTNSTSAHDTAEHFHSHESEQSCPETDITTTKSGKSLDSDGEVKKASTRKRQFGALRASLLKCAHCQFTCFRLPDLRHHLLEHTGDKVYECGRCSRSFRNKIGLYLHEQRKHKADLELHSDTLDRPATNDSAAEPTESAESPAEVHSLENSADRPVSKKKKSLNNSINRRLKRKSDDQADVEAGKEQGQNQPLNGHNSTDVSEKKHSKKEQMARKRCTETVEMVQSMGEESDHFKIVIRRKSSVGEEILETIAGVNDGMMCRFCGYMAKIPAQLTQHMKIHTGERDYWCTIGDCTYRTIWRCDMKRHFRKFHSDEVEQHGGSYSDLLKRSYQPSKLVDKTESSSSVESSAGTVNVFKLSKRQQRRLLKLQNRQHLKHSTESTEKILPENESQKVDSFVISSSSIPAKTKQPKAESVATSETKKSSLPVSSTERFRPYKCSECGRRSNWRWDLKKHVQAVHNKNAVIIKLNDDVARATFADVFSSQGGRNGIRFPRNRGFSADSLPSDSKLDLTAKNSRTVESGSDVGADTKPVSELERRLVSTTPCIKSIGMIDMMRLRRFQCSACPYRSNHRGDLGRHIRMRHGRDNCTVNVLSADVAAATLHSYRLQWNRKKAWLPRTDIQAGKKGGIKTRQKFHGGTKSGKKEQTEDQQHEIANEVVKTGDESELADDTSSRRQNCKDFWYFDDGNDETKCCDICPFKTDRTGLLELHKLRHRAPAASASTSSVTFSCPHCPYFVRTSRQLERHTALHEDTVLPNHDPLVNGSAVQHTSHHGPAKNRYVCEKCPFVSMFRSEFWLHRRHHFVPKVDVPYSCDLCAFWASDRRTMSDHAALHTQTYYPRLSVPVVSRYRPARVELCSADGDGTGQENISRQDTAGSEHETAAEDAQSKRTDDDMEVECCPLLEAVDQLESAADGTEVFDYCPLLEPECEPSFTVEPSGMRQSETLFARTPSPCVLENLMSPDCSEAMLNDNGTAYSDVVTRDDSDGEDKKMETWMTCMSVPGESLSSELVVTSQSLGDRGASEHGTFAAVQSEVSHGVSSDDHSIHCTMTATSSASLCAPGNNSVSSASSDVLMTDSKVDNISDDSPSEHLQLNEKVTLQSNTSVRVTGSQPLNDNSIVSTDENDADQMRGSELVTQQASDAVKDALSIITEALSGDCGTGDDVPPESKLVGKAAQDHVDSRPRDAGLSPDESTNDGNPESRGSDEKSSWCGCALQCPYCFFAIASVRLLRQHMMFHVAMSDAVDTPVFHRQLDAVDDGRMDDVRCAHLVRLCSECRRVAELGNPDDFAVLGTCTLTVSVDGDPKNSDTVTVSDEKAAMLSKLSLLPVM